MTEKTDPSDVPPARQAQTPTPSEAGNALADLGWSGFYRDQLDPTELAQSQPARIMAHNGQEITLSAPSGTRRLQLAGKFTKGDRQDRPTVGDWVLLERDSGQLQRVLRRKSLFKRKLPSDANAVQLIAANVDTLFIVTSCNQDFNLSRLERYLALAHESAVTPVLLLTKADLCDDPKPYLRAVAELGEELPVELLNATDPDAVVALLQWCGAGQTIALMGSSGTGKSTLINSLLREERQATGSIRQDDAKGRHTTTHRSLHLLSQGGLLLDSPGIRELNLTGISIGLSQAFADIAALMAACRFSRCTHQQEPGCAVQAALAAGSLETRRWENFQKLQAEQDLETTKTTQRRERRAPYDRPNRPGKDGAKKRRR